ncbi:MAG: PHP domain-containing protein [Chitinispirillaceae bacterium]
MNHSDYKELCGCIHLHTTYSDGGVNYEELISTAQKAQLDYIAVTDHMTLKGREKGYQGIHDDLIVIIGYEHNDKENKNHYLTFGTSRVMKEATEPQDYINKIKEDKGIGFLAHPAEKRNYFGNLPPYPWTEWDAEGYDGIELWNQMSDWMEQLKRLRSFVRLFYPRRFMGNIPEELIEKWDKLNLTRFVSGIGGVDAHTKKMHFGPLSYTIFPIKVELKGVRTHLYCDTAEKKNNSDPGETILSLLKNGNGFISNYRKGDARGSRIFMKDSKGHLISPGYRKGNASTTLPLELSVVIPQKADIHLFRNGKRIKVCKSDNTLFTIAQEGVYRVEVYKGSSAWIYSNPFPVGNYPFLD